MSFENTFGFRLKKALKLRAFTQTDLAKRLNTSNNMITLYVKNSVNPPGSKITEMAIFLDVSLKWLMFGEGDMGAFDYSNFEHKEKFNVTNEPDNEIVMSISLSKKEAKNIFKKFQNCLLT